jgi:hypothetical protein
MPVSIIHFLRDENAAVTVDWTALSAAAVSMALATVTVLEGGIDGLIGRIDGELRSQQMSDNFITYLSGHFEPMIADGMMSAEDGETFFVAANALLNHEILENLQIGIDRMVLGELPEDDLPILIALASVAMQRNIASDEMLDYYFGFDGGDPLYMDYY